MGTKKPYDRPVLQAHGDIRAITRGIKNFGNTDSLLVMQSEPPTCYEAGGECS